MDDMTGTSAARSSFTECDVASARPSDRRFSNGRIASVQSTDVAEFAELMHDWDVEFSQLQAGSFLASAHLLQLGSVRLARCSFNRSLLLRLTPPQGCLSIVMVDPGSDPVLFRGSALSKDQCVVLDTGAKAELVSHGQFFGTAITVSNGAWQAASHWPSDRSTAENRPHLESPGMQWMESVLADTNAILDTCIRYPEGAMPSGVGIAMEELVLASLTASTDCTRRPSDNRSQRARRRMAVQRARAYIDENLANPIRLSEVCAHAHAQARSLEYGFHEMLGITPVSYIKAVRLNRVRRLLLSSVPAERTVTEIALDCGFWHLSQFSVDYKTFFGESPSVTGRRTLAQRSRHGRRLNHS